LGVMVWHSSDVRYDQAVGHKTFLLEARTQAVHMASGASIHRLAPQVNPVPVCPGPCRRFGQAIGPEAQTTGEDEHDHRQPRLLHLCSRALGGAWVVAGMRLYVAERHSISPHSIRP